MHRCLLLGILVLGLFMTNPLASSADVSGLISCKDSPIFKLRLDKNVQKINKRLNNYEVGTFSYLTLQRQIDQASARFNKYSKQGLLCGGDGLPHLITDGHTGHTGEFIRPGLGFLYITGWIGWAGRSYIHYTKKTDKPNENEIIIDVPIALSMMTSAFLWPLSAWNELIRGEFIIPEPKITISPR